MRAVQMSNRSAKLVSMSRIEIDRYVTTENPASPHVNSSILAIKCESFSRVFIIGVPALARIGSDLNPRSRSTIWRRNLYRIASDARFGPRTKYSCNGDLRRRIFRDARSRISLSGNQGVDEGGNAFVQHTTFRLS